MRHALVLSILVLLLAPQPALAQEAAAVLERIDAVLDAPDDMTADEEMALVDADGTEKTRRVQIAQKGTELRLIQFTEPADVRGVGFLRQAEDRLYLYLPAFRKVRRIASSATNEAFMGTDFSYEDLSQSCYADDYAATALRQEDGRNVLALAPKPDADVSYGRLVLYADPSNDVLRRVDFYDARGTLVKVMTVDDVQQVGGYWIGRRMEMADRQTGHRTVLTLSGVQFDQGLSDRQFTERYLKRPVR